MDTDDEITLRKALDVGELPVDFDPNKIPQTGEEYLHYVMYEKMHCDEYVRADINEEKISNKTWEIKIQKGCEAAPKDILPTIEWQNQQISEFSAFRLYLEKIKDSKYFGSSYFNGHEDICRKKCSAEPVFSEMIAFNQNAITKLLEFHLEWLDDVPSGASVTRVTGIWIYALLARLEVPLTPERCFLLRELARKCSRIRSAIVASAASQKNLYAPLNLIICLVARYFNQTDLIDN